MLILIKLQTSNGVYWAEFETTNHFAALGHLLCLMGLSEYSLHSGLYKQIGIQMMNNIIMIITAFDEIIILYS